MRLLQTIFGSGATAANYDFDYAADPGVLTISKALLTVHADDATRAYGAANPTFTGTLSGFANSETASVVSGLVYTTSASATSGKSGSAWRRK